jgi:hypothetical protein
MTNGFFLDAADLGLLADIIGVIILGRALAFSGNDHLLDASGTVWNGNPKLLYDLVAQRTDAWFGLPTLVLGFLYQWIGHANSSNSPWLIILGWVLLAGAVITYVLCRGAIIRRTTTRLEERRKSGQQKSRKLSGS